VSRGRRTPPRHRLRRSVLALTLVGLLGLLLPSSSAKLPADALQTELPAPSATLALHGSSIQSGAASRAPSGRVIIGTNDAAGWGPRAARTILRGHITWNRVELVDHYSTLGQSLREGFNVLAIVNNPNDETPLSAIDPRRWGAEAVSELKSHQGVSIAEAGNEMYLKAGLAEPVQYGLMYLAAVEDMRAAGIHTPLLFNMTGDIPLGSWADRTAWSEDAHGGGWLRDAVNGVPGLAAAILANGISIHPYGAVGENAHDDWGSASVAADESVANAVLGAVPPVYVTEIGFDLARCGDTLGACSISQQASEMRAEYTELLADAHVRGIWWYQSHDDPTGRFGFMDDNNAPRPSFTTLSAIARSVGQ
jgi:hypothetical protein